MYLRTFRANGARRLRRARRIPRGPGRSDGASGLRSEVAAALGVGEDRRAQIVRAPGTREARGLEPLDPPEPVGVLALLAGNDVVAATEKENGARAGIEEIDGPGRARHDDPATGGHAGMASGPVPSIQALAGDVAGGAATRGQAAIDGHLPRQLSIEPAVAPPGGNGL